MHIKIQRRAISFSVLYIKIVSPIVFIQESEWLLWLATSTSGVELSLNLDVLNL